MGAMRSPKSRTAVLLGALLVTLLVSPQPVPAQAGDAPADRWVLVETRVNPNGAPTEFVVGVTPNYYESPRFDGKFDRYTVTATGISSQKRDVDHGFESWNMTSDVTFGTPPAVLIPGEVITLQASGSVGGSADGAWNPGEQFEFRADGVTLEGETYFAMGLNADAGPTSGSVSPHFTVPDPWDEDAEIRIRAFYWNCASCLVEWVYHPDLAPPSPTTTTVAATTVPPTTVADDPRQCIVHGRVADGGARPEGPPDREGHPLVGVRVALMFDTLDEVAVTATDADGLYEIIIIEDDLPFPIDSAADEFFVSLRLAEAAHDPPRFEVVHNFERTELWATPFTLDVDCTDGIIEFDFPLGAIPDDYLPLVPEAKYWDDLGEIYHRIHNGTRLADLLGQALDYKDMVVCAFCDKGAAPTAVFWCGARSNGGICAGKPWIGIGALASTLADPGWPDNREYHEYGHHFQADAFGDAIPGHSVNTNHAGYYVNPSSTDAWTEGFAEFFSMMVTKHIEGRPMPHLYRLNGTPRSLELDYRAWSNRGRYEELGLAGLLLDLEDGPDDYAQGRQLPDLKVDWHDTFLDPNLGNLIVGEVTNLDPARDYSEQTMVAAEFRLDGRVVETAWAVTTPWDLPGQGGRGFFAVIAPAGLEWNDVTVVAFEGRPGDVGTDDDPVDLTLQEVWDTIVTYLSGEQEGNGYLFDIVDLHSAFSTAYGGADADGNGMDDIDQVFIAHGFYADTDGDRSYRSEAPGRTDHPAAGPFDAMLPRRAVEPAPATLMTVDTGGVDAALVVQTWLPDSSAGENYSYIAERDAEGRYQVAVPPEGHGAEVTLAVLADGHDPALLATIDADDFWADVAAGNDTALTFTAELVRAAGNGRSGTAFLLIGGGIILLAGAAAWVFLRRRQVAGEASHE